MKKKFPIILIVIFSIFALLKIAFFYIYIDSVRDNSIKFESIIGALRYSIKPYEENSLKFTFAQLVHSLNDDEVNKSDKDTIDIKNQTDNITDYLYNVKIASNQAIAMNNALNKYTKKYLLHDIAKEKAPDMDKEKTIEDAYLDTQEIITNIKWDEKKSAVQKLQMQNLKSILSKEDYTSLTEIIDTMNSEESYLTASTHQKILSILLKYTDIDSYLILGQLCGKFKILAYYEIENGSIVQKELKAITTDTLSTADDKKYKNLINMQSLLLDVIYPKYFKGFFIFTDEEKGLLAYASDFQNKQRGYLGIDSADFSSGITNDFEKSRFYHSVISELARVILLGNDQVDYSKGNGITDSDNFDIIRIFSKKDSYLMQFYNRFWDDMLYQDSFVSSISTDENATKYFFLRHSREFLNEYVSQDPFRDIIESMARFMLEKKPLEVEQKYQKIRFFYEFSELIDIKQRLALNIKHLEEQ